MSRVPQPCRVCGEPVQPGARGPLPTIHPACDSRAYDARQTEMFPVENPKAIRITKAQDASAVEYMAVGLSVHSDPMRAALAAGLDLSVEEALALAERARNEYQDLIEGKTTAISRLARQTVLYLLINLRNSSHSLPPSQIAPSIKGLIQALEMVQGGMAPAYGQINLVIDTTGDVNVGINDHNQMV